MADVNETALNEEAFVGEVEEAVMTELEGLGLAGDSLGMIKRKVNAGARKSYRRAIRPSVQRSNAASMKQGQSSVTVATSLTKDVTTKGYFEFKKKELPKEIQEGLANGSLQFVDATIYVIKDAAGSKSVKMFSSADNEVVGLSNLTGAKLPKGQFFLMTGLSLDYASRTSASDLTIAKFDDNYPAALESGEISKIICGDENLLKDFPIANFPEGAKAEINHYIKLENPKWLREQEVIEAEIDTPATLANVTTPGSEDIATLRLRLHGGMVIRK